MWRQWRPYVPVARRRAQAVRCAASIAKKEKRELAPVKPEGRAIAKSFWGQAWCENLESYSDFENRLPRGRSYLRNGSVIDLRIEPGAVKAIVSGSEIYHVKIDIRTLAKAAWKGLKQDCSRTISSLIDLLQGRFDQGVMRRLSRPGDGLFPQPKEIKMQCSCPDWAGMCKHVAATLYGVGTRLDAAPELLFTLRNVDHLELVSQAVAVENLDATLAAEQDGSLAGNDLAALFGIELDHGESKTPSPQKRLAAAAKSRKPAPANAVSTESDSSNHGSPQSALKKGRRGETKRKSVKPKTRTSAVVSAKRKGGGVGSVRKPRKR
jgi:uncharacterized Zn finger protein